MRVPQRRVYPIWPATDLRASEVRAISQRRILFALDCELLISDCSITHSQTRTAGASQVQSVDLEEERAQTPTAGRRVCLQVGLHALIV